MFRRLLTATTLLCTLAPCVARAQAFICNPPGAPVGSLGCTLPPVNPSLSTTVYTWQAELAPSEPRQMPIGTLFGMMTQLTATGVPLPGWITAGRPTPLNPMIGFNFTNNSLDVWTGSNYLTFSSNWGLPTVSALSGMSIVGTTLTADWLAGQVTGLSGATIVNKVLTIPPSVLPIIASGDILGNSSNASAPAQDTSLSLLLDTALGSAPAVFAQRGATAWHSTAITGAITIDQSGVSHLANIPAFNILGNNAGGPAAPAALSQSQFTALVLPFGSLTAGTVPASGGGTANFLRADGTWAPVSQITSLASGPGLTGGGSTGGITIGLSAAGAKTVMGNATTASATPGALSQAQLTALVLPFSTTTSGAVPASPGGTTTFLRADNTWSTLPGGGTITAVNTTGGLSGGGSSGSVTVSLASAAGNSVLGVSGATPAVPAPLSQIQLTALVLPFSTTAAGVAPISPGGTATFLRADNTWATPPGGITGVTAGAGLTGGGSVGTVTVSLANAAANTILGNNTASPATPSGLTAAQFTAMVLPFTASTPGTVPASGGGTVNFLRADGTWGSAPSGISTLNVSGGIAGGGSGATVSIALANIATNTVLGNVGASAPPSPLTPTQLTTLVQPFALATSGAVPPPGTSQGFCLHDSVATPWSACSTITAISPGTGLAGGGSSGNVSLSLAAIAPGTGLVNVAAIAAAPAAVTLPAWMANAFGTARGTLAEYNGTAWAALPYTTNAAFVLTAVPGADPQWQAPQAGNAVNGMNFPASTTSPVPALLEVTAANTITYVGNIPFALGGTNATTLNGARQSLLIDAAASAGASATLPCSGVETTTSAAAGGTWHLALSTGCNNGSRIVVVDESGLLSVASPLTLAVTGSDLIDWPNQGAQTSIQITAPHGYVGLELNATTHHWGVDTQFAANSVCTDTANWRCAGPIDSTTFSVTHEIPNDPTTGTVVGELASAAATGPSTSTSAILSPLSTTFAFGVVLSETSGGTSATTGSAVIAWHGSAPCKFDAAAVTINHWVIPSTVTAGLCRDSGTLDTGAEPTAAVGIAMDGGAGSTTYPVYFMR